jgi:hypothetical protein
MRWLVVLLILSLAGCATKMGKDGRTQSTVDAKYLAKTEVDRIADTVIAAKCSRRPDAHCRQALQAESPKEWKKAGMVSREAALARLVNRKLRSLPGTRRVARGPGGGLGLQRDAYEGDRVAALMFGLLTMTDAAFEHKEEFYILDSLDETEAVQLRAQHGDCRLEARVRTAMPPASSSCCPTSSTRPTATSPSSANSAAKSACST